MKQEVGIESSVSEFEMKNYVEEVIAEIQRDRTRRKPTNV
jgi:hypothetical protein